MKKVKKIIMMVTILLVFSKVNCFADLVVNPQLENREQQKQSIEPQANQENATTGENVVTEKTEEYPNQLEQDLDIQREFELTRDISYNANSEIHNKANLEKQIERNIMIASLVTLIFVSIAIAVLVQVSRKNNTK